MSTALLLPRLGETMEQGRVVAWLKQPGDSFMRGETIVEIETDKTVVELPALADGVLRRIAADVGTDIDVGAPLGEYDPVGGEADVPPETGATDSAPGAAMPAVAVPTTPDAVPMAASATAPSVPMRAEPSSLRATPNARRLARQSGVDLGSVTGTGRRARIQGHDVSAMVDGAAPKPAAESASAAISTLTTPAGRIAYREWIGDLRDAAPLVLFHGFAGDSQAWAVLASQLQRNGRRVIAPDLPSHGATDFDRADPAALASAMVAFIEHLRLPAIDLVGHSLGAVVAAKVATALGDRVKQLTLIAPAGLGSEIDADFIEGMAHATHGGGLAHLLRRIAVNPPTLSAPQLDQMADAIRQRGALAPLARTFVGGGRQQVDISGELDALQGRTRIVWGLSDQIIPWHHATRAGPGIPVFFIPSAGHMPQWDQPQKVAALLV